MMSNEIIYVKALYCDVTYKYSEYDGTLPSMTFNPIKIITIW